MGLLNHSMDSLSLKGRRSSNASNTAEDTLEGNANDTSQLDKEEGNVLMSIISQLRPGMDLTKIALPTFVLEPRSLLERVTDFFSHPELVFGAGKIDDPQERFMRVMTMYLSGWHIKPKGVKKPYNPILGEFFRCSYFYEDGSEGYYLAEQVSHHPVIHLANFHSKDPLSGKAHNQPISAFFYASPKNNILVTGELVPKSKFLGNSAATIMEGEDRIRLLDRPEDGEYCISMPNTYARGILFGKLILELCEMSSIVCAKNDIRADIDFKAKGWISGGYNTIAGPVRAGRQQVGEVIGHWNSVIEYTDAASHRRKVIFDANAAKTVPKSVLPESEQDPVESRRLWANLTTAIKSGDMHGATAEKNVVEEKQRDLARKREADGQAHELRFFRNAGGNKWMPRLDIDNLPKDTAEMERAIKQFVFGDADKAPRPTSSSSAPTATTTTTTATSDFTPTSPPTSATIPQSPSPTQGQTRSSRSGSIAMAKSKLGTPSITSHDESISVSTSSASSSGSNLTAEPPAVVTAPGPPAPGPKADHPIASKQ